MQRYNTTYLKLMVVFAFIICYVWACTPKSENTVIYTEPDEEKLDSVCEWLENKANYSDTNYLATFYSYYVRNIKTENYNAAAKALELTSINLDYNYNYDTTFLSTLTYFSNHYRSKIPEQTTAFLDNYFGNYYFDSGNYKKASEYYTIITQSKCIDYKSCTDIARAYYDLSYLYFSQGKQDSAITTNFKSLAFYNKTNFIEGKGYVYLNFANIYKVIGNYKKAHENVDSAITNFRLTKNTYNTFIALYNKISIYEYSGDEKMYSLIDSTYHLYITNIYKNDVIKISIETYYIQKLVHENKLNEAKKMLEDLKPLIVKLNSTACNQAYDIAFALYEVKKNGEAIDTKIILNAIPALLENKQYEVISDFYLILKNKAINDLDYKNALLYEGEIKKVTDSLGSKDMKNRLAELDIQYQTEKKEQHITLQEKTITTRNTTIGLLGALLIGLFLVIILYISKQKQKKLQQEKQNVQHYTKQLLEKTEEERKRIASDLHDSVSHELLSLKNSLETKTDITNNKIDAIINDIRSISRNLHPVMFDKIGLKASIEQLIDRAQSVNDFMVTATINYTATLSITEELQLYRIIQEALSNIIKYADAIAAKITIDERQQVIHIEIKDNGKGFDVLKTLAGSNAFGLHNIIERSKAIGGEAKIVSDKNGTIITIEIPITKK
jgi:signal transduction histidine kinase